ncbi:methyl-accepting chemotaxis protein [Vibrio quintilis]|uniref:Methyl-accepting chemotaxis protein PctB n=1 Tax=Vibrio quintilis TaxID=1117707 RepID=A0A1M7YXC2_9VIBR|nr:methyl-accepting chemotaxis protein [Vibrio quintilis]SHO57317.1 Methyl-accepting chemotaxis protein PctB [Vibrio quintilis]
MKQIGMRKLLIFSVMLLVGLSVAISSYVLYSNEKETIHNIVMDQTRSYTKNKAANVQGIIGEKAGGLRSLSGRYINKGLSGSDEEVIEQTRFLARAMNLNSALIAFENGDAFWNQTAASWPNHKLDGDVKEKGWYQAGRKSSSTTVTNPYLFDGDYWITMVDKIKDGVIAVEYKLTFLNEIVSQAIDIPGSAAVIMTQDTTFLASSSNAIKAGEKGANYDWFRHAAQEAVSKESAVTEYSLNGVDKLLFSHRIKVADKNWYFAIGLDKSVAFGSLEAARNNSILIAFIATLISVAIAYALIQWLYRPILSLRDTITALSSGDGDLTQRLKVESKDELGQIAHGVNRFIENLQNIMLEIKGATSTLESNVGRLRDQSERSSSILQSHVSETEQIVTAIEEMNSTASSMATDAANTANLTQQANETSIESRRIVEQSQQTVSALISDVDKAALDVQQMNDETQNINTILNVIGDIAEQTNLLALNAAIEAARAGEQGRGFAVVADEVRNLASRTKDSTEEIETALDSLLKGTKVVVGSMDSTKDRCQETAEGAGEVSSSLETMTRFVDEINDLSTQIATAAEEQSSVTQELSRNMSAINDIVRELDTNGQQVNHDAQEISDVNQQLSSIVGRFKL